MGLRMAPGLKKFTKETKVAANVYRPTCLVP